MNMKLQIFVACVVIFAMAVMINMVRKKKLELKYALAWLGMGIGILILDCFPMLTTYISTAVGVANPVNMLFFCGFCFSLAVIFFLTVAVSRMSVKIRNLAQEIALAEKKEKRDEEDE